MNVGQEGPIAEDVVHGHSVQQPAEGVDLDLLLEHDMSQALSTRVIQGHNYVMCFIHRPRSRGYCAIGIMLVKHLVVHGLVVKHTLAGRRTFSRRSAQVAQRVIMTETRYRAVTVRVRICVLAHLNSSMERSSLESMMDYSKCTMFETMGW